LRRRAGGGLKIIGHGIGTIEEKFLFRKSEVSDRAKAEEVKRPGNHVTVDVNISFWRKIENLSARRG